MTIAIEQIRRGIDRIDFEILKLIATRMELGLRTRKYKPSLADTVREDEVLSGIAERTPHLVEAAFSQELFRAIIEESKRLQERVEKLVGFQGEHGAYGEVVARRCFPGQACLPFAEFREVFRWVEDGGLDYGVVPVENSIGGSVAEIGELIFNTQLKVVGEARLEVDHCLLAPLETDYRDIREVYSHPQALAQCKKFLARNRLEARPFYDTAGAAKALSENRWRASAVIASRLCASEYGLRVIKDQLADHEHNVTRFLVLAKEPATTPGNKCSVVFSTPHQAGQLFGTLRLFAEAGLNLTRIESIPIVDEDINYGFFLDFQGADTDPVVQQVLEKVRASATELRFLGCYPEGELYGSSETALR